MSSHETLLVTGGAGFIGSNFVLSAVAAGHTVVNLDALTYAGNLGNLAAIASNPNHVFVHGDINDRHLVESLLVEHRPSAIVHFAAESHVDRSIAGPEAFLKTNIDGTFTLLRAARAYFESLTGEDKASFRFLHVSTTRSTAPSLRTTRPFTRRRPYAPNSPLRRVEGLLRHARSRLGPHLQAARADHELLEQLRPVPVSPKSSSR